MEEKFNEFFQKFNEVLNTGDTSENLGQCVGLIECWTDFLGLPHTYGNAKDLLTNADPNYFEVITNTPDNIPQMGDIMVWGTQVGQFGHTAVFKSGDVNTFTSFDQNWPLNSAPHLQKHNYSGVLGWMRPKLTTNDQPVNVNSMPPYLETLFQEAHLDPNNEASVRGFWQKALSFDSTNTDKINAQTNLATANNQITDLQNQIDNLKIANKQQADMLDSAHQDIATLQTQIAALKAQRPPVPTGNPISYWLRRIFGNA